MTLTRNFRQTLVPGEIDKRAIVDDEAVGILTNDRGLHAIIEDSHAARRRLPRERRYDSAGRSAGQAQNVLFLADRDALVDQTLTDGFKAHLPHEPRDRVYTHQIDKTKRLFVATEQTLALCYAKFSPGFFDIIIFDEAHRSLFKRFTEVIEYFDARMIGLTATPANFIDRDTFRLFGCDANVPTFLYDYPQAVKEGFLVDFSLYQAHTSFQRKGIKGVDLSEEDRNALAEQGIDPDSLDYAGTEIEVEVSNKDTLRIRKRRRWGPVSISAHDGRALSLARDYAAASAWLPWRPLAAPQAGALQAMHKYEVSAPTLGFQHLTMIYSRCILRPKKSNYTVSALNLSPRSSVKIFSMKGRDFLQKWGLSTLKINLIPAAHDASTTRRLSTPRRRRK